jgi:limonene-1,2-epoxide hydrolase
VTGSFTGAAARDSAPYRAVQAYLQACQKKDLDAIKKAVTAAMAAELEQMVAAQGKKELLDMLAEATAETLKMTLTKVIVRGDSAEVAFADPKDSSNQQVMNAVLEKGIWKFGQ